MSVRLRLSTNGNETKPGPVRWGVPKSNQGRCWAQRVHYLGPICRNTLTMSSREIAELTGKQHKDVLRDVRVTLSQLGKDAAQFCASSLVPGPYGRQVEVPVFTLPKDLTITLVSGYSVPMRHRIVTRWMELESLTPILGPATGTAQIPQVPLHSPEPLTGTTTCICIGLRRPTRPCL